MRWPAMNAANPLRYMFNSLLCTFCGGQCLFYGRTVGLNVEAEGSSSFDDIFGDSKEGEMRTTLNLDDDLLHRFDFGHGAAQ